VLEAKKKEKKKRRNAGYEKGCVSLSHPFIIRSE
jgi:hypothetical protein